MKLMVKLESFFDTHLMKRGNLNLQVAPAIFLNMIVTREENW
jgi:hypothetical protein